MNDDDDAKWATARARQARRETAGETLSTFMDSVKGDRLRRSALDVDWHDVDDIAWQMLARKTNEMTPEQCVIAAIERVRTHTRRLAHDTGATGWQDH